MHPSKIFEIFFKKTNLYFWSLIITCLHLQPATSQNWFPLLSLPGLPLHLQLPLCLVNPHCLQDVHSHLSGLPTPPEQPSTAVRDLFSELSHLRVNQPAQDSVSWKTHMDNLRVRVMS